MNNLLLHSADYFRMNPMWWYFLGWNLSQESENLYKCNNEASGYSVSRKSCPKVFRKITLSVAFAPKEQCEYWSKDTKLNILVTISDGQRSAPDSSHLMFTNWTLSETKEVFFPRLRIYVIKTWVSMEIYFKLPFMIWFKKNESSLQPPATKKM